VRRGAGCSTGDRRASTRRSRGSRSRPPPPDHDRAGGAVAGAGLVGASLADVFDVAGLDEDLDEAAFAVLRVPLAEDLDLRGGYSGSWSVWASSSSRRRVWTTAPEGWVVFAVYVVACIILLTVFFVAIVLRRR
jgi:hypothetical protein